MSERCPTCGKPYKAELMQLRLGADEPAVEVKCVCNAFIDATQTACSITMSLMSVCYNTSNLSDHQEPLYRHTSSLEQTVGSRKEEQELRFDHRLSRIIYSRLNVRAVDRKELGMPVSVIDEGVLRSARLRIRSDEYSTIKYVKSRVSICPGVTLCRSVELFPKHDRDINLSSVLHTSQGYVTTARSKVVMHCDWRLRCDYHPIERMYSGELEFMGTRHVSEVMVQEILLWLHSDVGHIDKLSMYIPSQLVWNCKMSTISVVDGILPSSENVVYRPKVDGESAWAVDCGYLWYVCRPNATLDVVSWTKSYIPLEFGKDIAIVRVEHMSDGSLVYIDVLAMKSIALPVRRPYVSAASYIDALRSKPRVIIRPDLDSMSAAEESRSKSWLPSDGILAVDKMSSLTYRIKRPTVDLMCSRIGLVCSRGSKSVPLFPSKRGMRVGMIYECILSNTPNGPTIESYIPRPDKLRPNKIDTVRDAMVRATGADNTPSVIASQIVSMSFRAREHVYTTAFNSLTSGSLIIDVGSGRLQSLVSMESSSHSFLLCDPQLDARRLQVRADITDATLMSQQSILSLVKRMNQGKVKYAMYKGTISSLMENQQIMHYVLANGVPMTYCFSMSYVHREFKNYCSMGLVQIGCGFIYDSVGDDGYVFNDSMNYIRLDPEDKKCGIVRVYPDEEYKEHALTSRDLGERTRVTSILSCLPDSIVLPDRIRSVVSSMCVAVSV